MKILTAETLDLSGKDRWSASIHHFFLSFYFELFGSFWDDVVKEGRVFIGSFSALGAMATADLKFGFSLVFLPYVRRDSVGYCYYRVTCFSSSCFVNLLSGDTEDRSSANLFCSFSILFLLYLIILFCHSYYLF